MTTHNSREGIEEIVKQFGNELAMHLTPSNEAMEAVRFARKALTDVIHQELQKAREEERERIEAIFKELVPPHAMDLEDSVWLKRLLNKAFHHEPRF